MRHGEHELSRYPRRSDFPRSLRRPRHDSSDEDRSAPLVLQRELARRVAAVEKAQSTHGASRVALDALFASLQHRALCGSREVTPLEPRFTITNAITAGLTAIERARGFLEAATLSDDWVRRMSQRTLLLEAHHTTHIEGTHLTIEPSERLWAGRVVPDTHDDSEPETRDHFEPVRTSALAA